MPAHAPRQPRPDRPRRRSSRLAGLALLAALPLAGQDLQVMAGLGFGPFRNPPRRAFASLELNQKITGSPFGVWLSADVALHEGQYLGLGPMIMAALGPDWLVAAGSGPGYYSHRAEWDLGYELEFRSTFYLSRRLPSGHRLGLAISHYSNGGLGRHNPGAETLRLTYQVPIPW